MSLKEKLDEHRAGTSSRFTEEQRKITRRFQEKVDAAVRKVPNVGDQLPPFPLKSLEEARRGFSRLALVFFRGAW